jgi:hypothetical protein
MIEIKQRSVTRFFIPLLDVMTLLFCMFLLMPLVEPSEGPGDGTSEANIARLQRELDQLRKKLEADEKDKLRTARQRLAFRVLEIDRDTGKLYYFDPERIELDEARARELVAEDVRRRGVGKDELVYMIFSPPHPNPGHPTLEDQEKFARWFDGVTLSYDIPGVRGTRGPKP